MKKITLLFLFGLLNIALTIAQPVADFTMSSSSICELGDSILVTDISTGSPISRMWSVLPSGGVVITNATATSTYITFNNAGTFSVKLDVTDGAVTDSKSMLIRVNALPPRPDICMVTCDGNSVNNIVYWDKTGYSNVDSFIVYRETSSGMYSKIAAVSNDSLSEYIDTSRSVGPANGDPNIAAYRYKIQIRDSCGNFSLMSLFHSTIFITDAGSGTFTWSTPYTIESTATPVVNYVLLCDTLGVGVWGPVSSVSNTASAATDPGFSSHPTVANWRVKTAWGISCTPTRAAINTTRSNIKGGSFATGINSISTNVVNVYPNPANNIVTILLSDDMKAARIKIVDVLGQTVYSGQAGNDAMRVIDVSAYAKGVYTIIVESSNNRINKKLIVN